MYAAYVPSLEVSKVRPETADVSLSLSVAAANLHDPVFLLNSAGEITWANIASAKFLGRPSDSLTGVRLVDTLTPESAGIAEHAIRKLCESSQARSLYELKFIHRDLTERPLEINFSIVNRGGTEIVVGVGRDPSLRDMLAQDRRRAEFQSLQFQAALVELARSDSSTLEERLVHITSVGASALDVGRLSVWLFNETHTELRCLHLFNRDTGAHESGTVLQVERYPRYFEALQSQRTITAHDAMTDPLTKEFAVDYLPVFNITSMLDVPIRREGQLVGVLCHEHTGVARRWNHDEQHFAASLADLIALVLETQRRREAEQELQRRERERAEAALRDSEDRNVYLSQELHHELNFEEIIGTSAAMHKVFQSIDMVAQTNSTVLLLGETGTGKELIARAVHNRSRRKNKVMVKLNCGALPATLVESELFGHEKGAFTGAVAQRKGRFELAHEGTLFLDEIGELSPEVQTRLLRVLQEQEFERVGGTRSIKVDVRVITATNKNLSDEVRRGVFRADLFYRLNVFPIQVPALRERPEDIELLTNYFVRRFSHRMGRRITGVQPTILERLQRYQWPGNVRELANVIERAVILCQGDLLDERHIGALASQTVSTPKAEKFPTLEEAERRIIVQALEQTGGVLSGPKGAAELLGVNRSTLWSRMQKLGIQIPKTK